MALGFLNWLLTYLISLWLLPIEIQSELAAHIAHGAVIVAITAVCAWTYLPQSFVARHREGLIIGLCWTLIALVLDVPARWLIDNVTPLAYLKQFAAYMLLILLTCSAAGFMLRFIDIRRTTAHVKDIPPLYRRR